MPRYSQPTAVPSKLQADEPSPILPAACRRTVADTETAPVAEFKDILADLDALALADLAPTLGTVSHSC